MTKEEMLEAAEHGTMKCSVCGRTMDMSPFDGSSDIG